jgi:CxxC motif-containing protein (DUF1111 family)
MRAVAVALIAALYGLLAVPAHAAPPALGDPIAGLTGAERALFEEGRAEFVAEETVGDGLGPNYTATSCGACHNLPVIGGTALRDTIFFGSKHGDAFDPLFGSGGPVFHPLTIAPLCQQVIPKAANLQRNHQPPPLFGIGLIDSIPDEQIIAYAAWQASTDPEIAGAVHYPHYPLDSHPGRYTTKALTTNLLETAAFAYFSDMGITNDIFPSDSPPNGDPALLARCDSVSDPEDRADPTSGRRGIDRLANFMRFLAPPPRVEVPDGEAAFAKAGCASCHTDTFTTRSAIPALDGQQVRAYTDLLMHDIGTNDDLLLGSGPGIRTAALWGLHNSAPYLHDGSAPTVQAAIEAHHRQGQKAHDGYAHLSQAERAALLKFLDSI